MNEKKNQTFLILLIYSICNLLLGEQLSNNIFIVLGIGCWTVLFVVLKQTNSSLLVFVRFLILSLPLSFVSINGSTVADSNLTWFNIFFFLIVVLVLIINIKTGRMEINSLVALSLLLFIISLFPVLISFDIMDAFRQYLFIVMMCLSVLLGINLSHCIPEKSKKVLINDYITATKITSIGLVIQIVITNFTGRIVGYQTVFGGGRHAFGFLFQDFSFLSLFLASGAILIYFNKKIYLTKIRYVEVFFLLGTSILTTARTGIIAFLITFALFSFFKSMVFLRKGSIKSIGLFLLNAFSFGFGYLAITNIRALDNIVSDTGRGMLNNIAFSIFMNNPLFGIGFGRENYLNNVGMMPHNLWYQSLAQGGILFTIVLFLFWLTILKESYRTNNGMFQILMCIFIGALFIPNIFHSRFLPAILIISSLRSQQNKNTAVNIMDNQYKNAESNELLSEN